MTSKPATLNALSLNVGLCALGLHRWSYIIDIGRDTACRTEFAAIWQPDVRVICERCGKMKKAKLRNDSLPELIVHNIKLSAGQRREEKP